jgi:uncharacterized protein
MSGLLTVPGVRREDVAALPPRTLPTGVPAMLGYAAAGPVGEAIALRRSAELPRAFGEPGRGYLAAAVAAFFRNGGERCYVIRLDDGPPAPAALEHGLTTVGDLDEVDLVCAPDVVRPRHAPGEADLPPDPGEVAVMQRALLDHCEAAATRVALLDALPGASTAVVRDQAAGLRGAHGALYYPWPAGDDGAWVPPSGHVAGVISRVDRTLGVHHAPANVPLDGVRDLERGIDDPTQGLLRESGVNCLRAFPGRGIRVWDALTLSREPEWSQLNVRRLVSTLARWIAMTTRDVAFEPNAPETWARTRRALTAHLDGLFRLGALAGGSPDEAYAVRCDDRTNPPELRAAGRMAVEVLLAPAGPIEIVAVRIVRHPAGVTVEPVTD